MLRRALTLVLSLGCIVSSLPAQLPGPQAGFPFPEKLTYRVEWRLITAGNATVQLLKSGPAGWTFNMNLESAGLVTRLYKVLDSYKISTTNQFCLTSAVLDAQEGKKHKVGTLAVDNGAHQISYDERDVSKSTSSKTNLPGAPACTYEIVGALAALRTANLPPGKSMLVPITDGKKLVRAKVEAQARENVTVNGKSYATTRYEAFVFDGVLYKRKGRLLVWVTNDPEHLPVVFRLLIGFPIGTVTAELQKHEKY